MPATRFSFPRARRTTIGPGLLLCEIQQHSDLTYRVYDYNRPDAHGKLRPLHIEKALQVMRFGAQPGGKVDPVQRQAGCLDGNISRRLPLFRHREVGIERAHRRRHVARAFRSADFSRRAWTHSPRRGGHSLSPDAGVDDGGGAGRVSTGARGAHFRAAHLCSSRS